LESVFPIVRPYQTHIPSFIGLWGFVCASESLDPTRLTSEAIDARIAGRVSKELRSYDGLTHQAMFTMPKHSRHQVATTGKVITDKEPISAY